MEKEDILIEFARRLDDLNITEGEVRPVMMGVVERFLDEGTWQSLDEEAVVNRLFEGIALYGLTNWEPMAPLERWTEKEQTQAEVETFILDSLYMNLLSPPFTEEDKHEAAELVYQHVWQQSASGQFGAVV